MKQTADKTVYRKSRQRERILELLKNTDSHPTADWLYAKLKKEFPNLSLGTVYRNLSVLSGQGVVKKLQFGSTFDRFEARIDQHSHLVCDECGKIVDFMFPINNKLLTDAAKFTDFDIKSHKIEFYGLCSGCRNKSVNKSK